MLLRDADLRTLVLGAKPIATPIGISDGSEASQVQPSSLDLRIGKICLPEVVSGQPGSVDKPLNSHELETGHTAVLETMETLDFPDDIGAIGFPPDSVSSKGLLMTNPGHVDPGYRGPMKFTVINMGRKPFTLTEGKAVVTLLLFKLDTPTQDDWFARVGSPGRGATPEMVSHLSRDFLNVEARAKRIAKGVVTKARFWTVVEALLGTLIVVAIAIGPIYIDLLNKTSDQREQIARLTTEQQHLVNESATLEQQVQTLTERIARLESRRQ